MDKYALRCAIRHIYFNDFCLDRTFILKDLSGLYLYYADENTPPEIRFTYSKLSAWLMKLELIQKYNQQPAIQFPKDYNSTLNATSGAQFPLFKFSPVINLPPSESEPLTIAQINGLINEFAEIDVESMAAYVKKRIYEKNDFAFVEDEDLDIHDY